MSRVGIYGGTFDPIHLGHLHVITQLIEKNLVDQLLVVPAGMPLLREDAPIATGQQRRTMCQLALADLPTDIATKEDRELIATMAQIDKSGRAVVRIEETVKGKDGKEKGTGEYIEKLVSELNTDDVKKLAEQQKNDAKSMDEIAKDQLTELKRISSSMNAFVGAAKYGIASSNTAQEGYIGGLRMFQNLLDEKIPSEGKKTQNWRTGTENTVGTIGDFIKSAGISDLMSTFTTKAGEYFDYLKNQVSSVIGMGGVDTEGPSQTLIQTLNNPNLDPDVKKLLFKGK